MSFFKDHNKNFILEPREQPGLRKCQLGAIWALKSYYTMSSNEVAALISMPTGERVIIVMGAVNVMKPRVSGTLNKYILCIA